MQGKSVIEAWMNIECRDRVHRLPMPLVRTPGVDAAAANARVADGIRFAKRASLACPLHLSRIVLIDSLPQIMLQPIQNPWNSQLRL